MPDERLSRFHGWRRALGLSLCLFIAAAAASPPETGSAEEAGARELPLAIPLHEAVYHASVRRIPVRAGLRLEQQGERIFLYRSWVEPRGLLGFVRRDVSESSLVRVDAEGEIVPLSYRRRDDFSGRGSDMRFDPINGKVHIDYRGEQTTTEWEPGIYDLLSLRLVLANDLAQGRLRDVYHVIDDRARVEEAEVEVSGPEMLRTPIGELETMRLEYTNHRRDRRFKLWIATEMDAALVKLEQYEEGRLRGSLNIVEYRRL
jgi:hypothetical protein